MRTIYHWRRTDKHTVLTKDTQTDSISGHTALFGITEHSDTEALPTETLTLTLRTVFAKILFCRDIEEVLITEIMSHQTDRHDV